MRLSWNEIRARAAKFSNEWADAHYEKGETHSFYNDFFEVFGVQRRRVAVYEQQIKKLDNTTGFIDLFWPSVLLVEQKSAGKNLEEARKQAEEYCLSLSDKEFPRFILLSDFQTFQLFDLEENTEINFALTELHKNVEKLGFIIGVSRRPFRDQDPVNIEASELMGKVHDALEDSGYTGHDLEKFLVRLLFCLFADDTGIFESRDIFEIFIKDRTSEDGSDLGGWLSQLFEVLNTPEDKRYDTLDEDLQAFPYINGDLFEGQLSIPAFDAKTRKILIDACEFSWDDISPAIFGALFQSIMDEEERRRQGAHYTTEKNIMKVIGPLFMDELWNEFKTIKKRKTHRKKLLLDFQSKLSKLTFFDPACGCGNFLIITYRELRLLEIEVLKELKTSKQLALDVADLSKINVDQFYGIEISEFPSRIAEVAMWMMDHIMNNRMNVEFGIHYARIPLSKSPNIHFADALEIDWQDVIQPNNCSFILGNPPFVGAKRKEEEHKKQISFMMQNLGISGGTLDYVCAWHLKAGEFVLNNQNIKIGFVSTNSITQGEQVSLLWPILFDKYGLDIIFAHRTFLWGVDGGGAAKVHVVIVGLARKEIAPQKKRLFTYDNSVGDPVETHPKAITAYLFDADGLKNPHLVISKANTPINGLPKLIVGSKPIDGGYFILSEEEKNNLIKSSANAKKYIHPYVGGREFVEGNTRYILHLSNANPTDLKHSPELRKIISNVRDYRSEKIPAKGKGKIKKQGISSKKLSATPTKYHITVVPDAPFLAIPQVTTKRRDYVPIGWMKPPVIPSNLLNVMEKANKVNFALLTSAMHMTWMRYVGGRMRDHYRYSIGLIYNTFPLPEKIPDENKFSKYADTIIQARLEFPKSALIDLYDPDSMPIALRKAHADLDRAVDKLYREKPFDSERERTVHLLNLYDKMTTPMV